MTSMRDWQKIIHRWAISKEWRGPRAETQRTTGDDIALMVSEAAEALEAYRETNDPRAYWTSYTVMFAGLKFKNLVWGQAEALGAYIRDGATYDADNNILWPKPEGVGPELADLIIRVLDYAEHVGLDMDAEVERKMAHNETREVRHGGMHL